MTFSITCRGSGPWVWFLIIPNNVQNAELIAWFLAESLDDLAEMIVQLFGDVENKDIDVPCWPEHPYGPNEVKVRETQARTEV